jgi:hypothetical protein
MARLLAVGGKASDRALLVQRWRYRSIVEEDCKRKDDAKTNPRCGAYSLYAAGYLQSAEIPIEQDVLERDTRSAYNADISRSSSH